MASAPNGTPLKETEIHGFHTLEDLNFERLMMKAQSEWLESNEIYMPYWPIIGTSLLNFVQSTNRKITLQTAHEGTNQVKESKMNCLMREYEIFQMKEDETIDSIYSKFNNIITKLLNLGKKFSEKGKNYKLLRSLTISWQPKITAIEEANDLTTMKVEMLIGKLKTFEMQLSNIKKKEGINQRKNIALKALRIKSKKVQQSSDNESEDEEIVNLARNFKKFLKFRKHPSMKGGAVLLFDREVVKNFYTDGYDWRKKRSGRYSAAHWKLKVNKIQNIYVKCTHSNEDLNFCRRIFWLLDKNQDHIALVHYRHTSEESPFPHPSPALESTGSIPYGSSAVIPGKSISGSTHSDSAGSFFFSGAYSGHHMRYEPPNCGCTVAVIGHFSGSCKDMQSQLYCVFDETPVAARMVQNGVYCCTAVPHGPGWVDLFLSLDGSVPISKFVRFEYRPVPILQSSGGYRSFDDNDKLKKMVNQAFKRLSYELFSTLATTSNLSDKFRPKSLEDTQDYESAVSCMVREEWTKILESTVDSDLSDFLELFLKTKLHEWLLLKVAEGFKATPLDSQGQGVIHLCAILGYAWSVPLFLTARFSLDTQDSSGWTALHCAAYHGRVDMVTALLKGANPRLVTEPTIEKPDGFTLADLAYKGGYDDLGAYLQGEDFASYVLASPSNSATALASAAALPSATAT